MVRGCDWSQLLTVLFRYSSPTAQVTQDSSGRLIVCIVVFSRSGRGLCVSWKCRYNAFINENIGKIELTILGLNLHGFHMVDWLSNPENFLSTRTEYICALIHVFFERENLLYASIICAQTVSASTGIVSISTFSELQCREPCLATLINATS